MTFVEIVPKVRMASYLELHPCLFGVEAREAVALQLAVILDATNHSLGVPLYRSNYKFLTIL
jgi:hypothetical protein